MERIYMITNRTNGKRYIDYTDGPLCDITITNKDLLKDIEIIYRFHGIRVLEFLHISELAIIHDDRYIEDLLRVFIIQYAVCGLYNEGYSDISDNAIICIDNGFIYDTASLAEVKLGIDGSAIRKACRGKRKSAGGYRWAYYKDYINGSL